MPFASACLAIVSHLLHVVSWRSVGDERRGECDQRTTERKKTGTNELRFLCFFLSPVCGCSPSRRHIGPAALHCHCTALHPSSVLLSLLHFIRSSPLTHHRHHPTGPLQRANRSESESQRGELNGVPGAAAVATRRCRSIAGSTTGKNICIAGQLQRSAATSGAATDSDAQAQWPLSHFACCRCHCHRSPMDQIYICLVSWDTAMLRTRRDEWARCWLYHVAIAIGVAWLRSRLCVPPVCPR